MPQYAPQFKRDPELRQLADNTLTRCIKYRYQVAAHAADKVDQAMRMLLKGEKPEVSVKVLRRRHVLALDELQLAIDERDFRAQSMR